jgi:hypothetical protein
VKGLFFLFAVLFLAWVARAEARLLPAKLPDRISLLVLAPGKSPDAKFGHAEFLLSYAEGLHTNDITVGFGPKLGEKVKVGSKAGTTLILWRDNFRKRLAEVGSGERSWLKVVTLKLNPQEKQEVINWVEYYNANLSKFRYFPLGFNCTSIVSFIVASVKGRRLVTYGKNFPLAVAGVMARRGWTEPKQSFRFSSDYVRDDLGIQ